MMTWALRPHGVSTRGKKTFLKLLKHQRQSLTRKGPDSYSVRLNLSCFPAQVCDNFERESWIEPLPPRDTDSDTDSDAFDEELHKNTVPARKAIQDMDPLDAFLQRCSVALRKAAVSAWTSNSSKSDLL